jgi:hypothetical protein
MIDRPTMNIDGEEWTRIARSPEVSERQGFRVELDIEHDLALFRVDGIHVQSQTSVRTNALPASTTA